MNNRVAAQLGIALSLMLPVAAYAATPEELRRAGDAAMTRAYIAIGVVVVLVIAMLAVLLRKRKK